jgi:hypothetical protein
LAVELLKLRRSAYALIVLTLVLAGPVLAEEEANEITWPVKLTGDKGEIVIYQPQIESFVGNKLESRAAISVKMAGQDKTIFGAMWFESDLDTNMETRIATLVRTSVTAAKFPDMEQDTIDKLSRYIEQEVPTWELEISIDRLIAGLPDQSSGSDQDYKGDPPVVHYRTSATVLVMIDGDPILTPLSGFELEYVANSAFFMVKDQKKGYFLRGAGFWFTSTDIAGPWQETKDLPSEVAKVSQKIDEEEAAQATDQAEDAAALEIELDPNEPAPEVIISTVPAELIVTEGEADFASVDGTQLLYLKNTESDVLMDIASQNYYVLISGRWFTSKTVSDEAWAFVKFSDLPADFANIPDTSEMATVLASVPGTNESKEAILETQIPQTAEVDRKTASCEVTFDGDPEFEKCSDTEVAFAINADKSVLLIDGRYYCVDTAVWFESANPTGPWQLATEVPAIVQELPPECPVYNVKYVYIYETTPEVIYVGYTSGYYNSYVWGPCVVYGTGWYYSPWWGSYYYPRPVTYGYGVAYSPYGGWGFTFGVSYGWLSVGVGWGRPPYYWGASGYRYGYRRGYWHGYNRGYSRGYAHGYRRGAAAGYRAGNRNSVAHTNRNAYRNRSNGVKRTGDARASTGKRPSQTGGRNDVYSDKKGDVYRDREGSWEKRDGDKWSGSRDDKSRESDRGTSGQRDKSADRSKEGNRDQAQKSDRDRSNNNQQADRSRDRSKDNQQLNRDRQNRSRGNERQQQSQRQQSGQRRGGGGGRRR